MSLMPPDSAVAPDTRALRVEAVGSARLPTAHGEFVAHAFRDRSSGIEHLALTMGSPSGDGVLARMHSECLTGDVLGSRRCDCGEQLDLALQRIAEQGCGVLLYLRGQEGRGIGIGHKIQAYALQDSGLDTVAANVALGLPVDARRYDFAADMLRLLGVRSVRLMSNNPDKKIALEAAGIPVTELLLHAVPQHADNRAYLQTKRTRMGHLLDPA